MRVRATRLRRLRIRKAIGHTALAAGLLAIGGLYLALQKSITLVIDGRPQVVRTLSGSVGQLLNSQGIVLDSGDMVEPPVTTSLADGMTVFVDTDVFFAVPPAVGATDVGVWVVDGVSGPFVKLAVQPTEYVLSADGFVGPSLIVGARVVVTGKGHDVLTNAPTVGELLSAMGIELDALDRVLPSPSTPLHSGIRVRYVDIELRTRTVRITIPFRTITTSSEELAPGEVKILRPGVPGTMLRTLRVRIVDGKVAARKVISERVLVSPLTAKRAIGLRESSSGSQLGEAVWYDAPGSGLTAAHRTLPFGTVVTVTNLDNGKSVTVVITDRGPYGDYDRIVDLSPEAFSKIAPLGQGVARVRISW